MANKNIIELTKRIEGDTWKEAIDKAFVIKQKEVAVDGFRKGKVPRDIFEKKYGKESLFIYAAENLLQDAYRMVMDENKELIPVIQPSVDIKKLAEDGVEYLFTITTKPEVKIKKYKGLKLKKDSVKVTKEEIDHEIKHLLADYSELVIKDTPVATGDTVIIDFEGSKDGVPFDGGKADNYSLEIGSNSFIPGFEEQLVGMKKEEEKDINVTFPVDYHAEDLKGKEVVFKVKVHEIKTKVERKLDKDFFEDLGHEGVNSKETLENEIKKNIESQKEINAENKYVDDLLAAIAKETDVDIPQAMVDEEVERLMHQYEEKLKMQGLTLDLYYQFTKTKEEDLKKSLEKEAFNYVLYRLILEEITKIENINISDDDALKEANALAEKYKVSQDEFLKNFGGIEMIKYDLEMRKVIDLLKEYNK